MSEQHFRWWQRLLAALDKAKHEGSLWLLLQLLARRAYNLAWAVGKWLFQK